ncbi:stalk domain-containing protein [Heyndrickxia vini]|uniref:Copper amine oxidase N-terminal domain-containing protein n=1 Tax=Heyndrickxia vini TaxID=1476025 RepID=A0ABX7DX42_9BACI|nr:stalk domain-containing protein [Heyndrickxia vini]QQZ08058.1 copper amine oxidase N-terminal domain-containing protein [Heyndrickxia vini]
MLRKRNLLYLIPILLLIISFLLYFQWDVFSAKSNQKKINTIKQDIIIEHHKNQFYVKQIISSVSSGNYTIDWPQNAKKHECLNDNRQCQWTNEEKTNMKINSGKIVLKYRINMNSNGSALLLKNWVAQLKDQKVAASKIQLIEKQFRHGMWIAAAEKTAVKKKKYINYFVFDINGQAPSLFWHEKKLLKKNVNNWLTIYYQRSMNLANLKLNTLEKIKAKYKMVIVLTNDYQQTFLSSLLIANNVKSKGIEEQVVMDAINHNSTFPKEEEWMKDFIASIVIDKAIGTKKAQFMYSELKGKLSKDHFHSFTNLILNMNEIKLSSGKLDQLIIKATGLGTNFFKENKRLSSPNKSFVLFDRRKIVVRGKDIKNLHVYTFNGKNFLLFNDIAESLGYKVESENKNQYVQLKNNNNHFTFYFGEKIFTYNGEKYGLLANPFIHINGESYIDMNWLHQLFHIKVDVNDKQISIN